MGDEKIEQNVTLSDHAQAGDITLIGKIVQVYNIIKQPALWQDAVWDFLTRNRNLIIIWLFFEVLIGIAFFHFKNLYLIPVGRWLLAAVLFTVAFWSAGNWLKYKLAGWNISVTFAATLAFAGLVSWQGWQIAFPEKFEPQVFGIVIAELSEGANLQPTAKTIEISNQVYEHLCTAIQDEFSPEENPDPCKDSGSSAENRYVQVKRIGVIPDSPTAHRYGSQIQADVVIWGQILNASGTGATIRFQVLETFDRAVNPEFPVVLPVRTQYTDIFISELALKSDRNIKDVVAEQSAIISSFTLGLVAYLNRNFPQAVNDFEKAAKTAENPDLVITPEGKSLLYFYLGRSNHAIGRFEEGQQWLKRAQEANPSEPAIPIGLAIGYGGEGLEDEKEKQLQSALDLINIWLQTRPEDNVATYDRGLIYHILKQYEDAILDYQSIIDRDPNYYVAYITLGQAAAELGEYQRAEDSYQHAIALADRSGANPAWAYLNLALVNEKAGNMPSAKDAFLQAITHAPQIDTMYLHYARFLENQKELDGALLTYRKLLEVTKDKGWGYSILADFFRRHGLLKKALENYKQAVHEKPKDNLLRTNLAEVYFDLGDVPNAKKEFEAALGSEASYYSYASYAGVLFQLGEFEAAARMYEEALKRRPADYAVLLNLGRTYEILDEPTKAIEAYHRIIAMGDQFPADIVREALYRLSAIEDSRSP